MPLPYKQLRTVHLIAAPLIGLFVYSPLREADWFVAAMQWVGFPVIAACGLALWLGPRLARRRRPAARGAMS